jgi:hypothetical protein
MALTSPGVEVQVIDESFYTPAEPGTVPLIVVATAQNKLNGAGTAVAAGTLSANAGKVFRISSQRELVETFGVPFFEKTATGNPVHGGERNEYGLLAAYSLMGVTNSAFICRADVDLNELAGSTTEPGAEPRDGTWWINSASTAWGIQEWNNAPANVSGGQRFTTKFPIRLTDADDGKISSGVPKESVGSIGDYCVVYETISGNNSFGLDKELAKIYYKSPGIAGNPGSAGAWVLLGSTDWALSWPTVVGTASVTSVSGTVLINGVTVTGATLADVVTNINSNLPGQGIYAQAINNRLHLYSDGRSIGGTPGDDSTQSGAIVIAAGTDTALSDLKLTAGTYIAPRVEHAPHTQRPLWKEGETEIKGIATGSVWIKTTEPNGGARLRVSRWNSSTSTWVSVEAPMYKNTHEANFFLDRSGGGSRLDSNTLFTQYNAREFVSDQDMVSTVASQTAEFRIWRRRALGATVVTSIPVTDTVPGSGNYTITMKQSIAGSANLSASTSISFSLNGDSLDDADEIAGKINAASFFDVSGNPITNQVVASVSSEREIIITHKQGGEIRLSNSVGIFITDLFTVTNLQTGAGTAGFYGLSDSGIVTGTDDDFLMSNWIPLGASINPTYYVAATGPTEEPNDGQLWYNPTVSEVDIMIHNGNTWVGYRHSTSPYFANGTDPNGPIVAASMPLTQSDGTTPLKTGDLWISTADLENYPTIYRLNNDAGNQIPQKWVLLDKTDQTTEDGVLFTDARINGTGTTNVPASIRDLLTSNFLDPDAPDPALYPKGMLLWNTRRSYGNVKRYANNYINQSQDNPRYDANKSPDGLTFIAGESMTNYATDRWVTASPNNEDGSGTFGRKAQRAVVVQRLKSVIDTSEEARDEERRNFNIIAAPGYPELLSNLINLNLDRKVTAFVIGDTPLRLRPDTTSLLNYATNAALALDNSDTAIVSYDEYCAVYYPNGFTTDLSGTTAVVPASHMMLRTITLSDQVSYPWFAPAGTRRGGITNATSVGYLDSRENEFVTVALNTGQRDTLYEQKINPIPFFVGVGLVAFGQKTRARNASALDRINVARLVVYLRSQLQKLARPYIFEPNDKITRDEIKGAVESLLIELVGLRALYDFAVVCDESNNTPARIDRNELWVDIAIEPVKAVEFIYIPLRLKNTGEI